jgi:inosine-uridine nucleoside N-ribohydrolase
MGEVRDDDEEATAEWQALVDLGDRYPDAGFARLSEQLREGGPPPVPLAGAPVIIDTDIGGDPDDALALVAAARSVPELALVVTSDERGGDRARFARHLLDLLGRSDVTVVAGAERGPTRYFVVDGLIPDSVPSQRNDVTASVLDVCARTDGQIRWVGMGPMSNLAGLLTAHPDLAERLIVTQMGGALNYRDPNRAEHNIRLDTAAARTALRLAKEPHIVTSDVTFTPEIEITADCDIYRQLNVPGAPAWAHLVAEHLDRWFASFHPGTIQHDALALSAALQLPFVEFDLTRVVLDDIGRMSENGTGSRAFLSYQALYPPFLSWLSQQLTVSGSAAPRE